MNEIRLHGMSKDEIYCEITDVLNQFNIYKGETWELYICVYSKDCLAIRGIGATRGFIKFNEDHIITEIQIYNDSYNYGKHGIFKIEDKPKIIEEINKFIGYKIP